MGGGLESRCLGRVYGADGAVQPHATAQKYLCKEPVLLGHAAASLVICSRIFELSERIENLGNRLHSDTVSHSGEAESRTTPL